MLLSSRALSLAAAATLPCFSSPCSPAPAAAVLHHPLSSRPLASYDKSWGRRGTPYSEAALPFLVLMAWQYRIRQATPPSSFVFRSPAMAPPQPSSASRIIPFTFGCSSLLSSLSRHHLDRCRRSPRLLTASAAEPSSHRRRRRLFVSWPTKSQTSRTSC